MTLDFEQNEHFRELVDSAPDPIAIHCDDEIVYINKAGAALLGSDKETIIGKKRLEVVHPDFWDDSSKHTKLLLHAGGPSSIREIKLMRHDGSSIEVGIKSAPITYKGRPAVQVVYRDITEQKEAEKALKESNELVTNILESITDAFFAVDHNWRITYVNQICEKYLQKKAIDILGNNLWEQFPVLINTQFYHAYHKALAEKVVVEFEEFSPLTEKWYEVRACPTKDGLAVYYRDITERKAAEEKVLYYAKELEISQSQLRQTIDNIDAGVWSADLRTNEFTLSQGIEKIYGIPMQSFYDDPSFWKKRVHPDDLHIVELHENEMFSGKPLVHQFRIIHASGEIRELRNRITPIFDDAKNLIKIVGIFVDITVSRRMEQSIRESREWFSTTLKCIGDGVIATDKSGRITFMNPIAEMLTAWKEQQALGRPIDEVLQLVNEETRQEVTNPIKKVIKEKRVVGLANHTLLINKAGAEIPIDDSAAPILSDKGEMIGIVMVFRDVIERKRHEEEVKHYAFHDALTGLPNRRLFHDRLTLALSGAKRNDTTLATMFLDLDHFKLINDSLGHEMGDLLLKEVAGRLTQCVREGDTVARMGGDEFIIILGNTDEPSVTRLADRIIERISTKYSINDQTLFISPSIGVSLYPDHGDDAETLIKNADMAMYAAKASGKNNCRIFAPSMNAKVQRKMGIEKGLRAALENRQFELFYQSKMELMTGAFLGAEALIRWNHPELGLISPIEFIPIAEETGLIVAIGEWVLETACRQCKEWQTAGYPSIRVAVNISTLQLRQRDLITTIDRILSSNGLDPTCLELEITESAMQNEETIKKLIEIKAKGIYISIDDFGTGYSSLSYLKRLPIDALKIDRSFIHDIYADPRDAEIVTTIITLAKSLQLKVIAEGVETEQQLAFLKQYQCDEVQGYLIGKPVPLAQFDAVLKEAGFAISKDRTGGNKKDNDRI